MVRSSFVLALLAAFFPLASFESRAFAQAAGASPDPYALQIHAFASQGFALSTGSNYLPHSKTGSFELAELGINFTKPLTDRMRMGLQLFARDFGRYGNYTPTADWFYLDYRFADWLGLRAGRVKVPFGLYNEINDVDAARVPILLPQSLYPAKNRDYLLAQTGGELYGRIALGGAGTLDYRAYGGTIFLDANTMPPGTKYQTLSLELPYVFGTRVLWETPLDGLRVGGSLQYLRVESDLLLDPSLWTGLQAEGMLPASFAGKVSYTLPVLLGVASLEYGAHDWLFAMEYSRWHSKVESTQPLLIPEDGGTSERMYAMLTHRFNAWFEPGAYYSLYFPDTRDKKGRGSRQHDTALTLRFDVNDFWLIKLEGHFMHGTADLSPELNDGTTQDHLAKSWGLFLVKTTAYF